MTILLFLPIFLFTSCGQKKEEAAPAVQQAPAALVIQLPELEQNKIYQTNREADIRPPDYTFQPVPDEQEHPPSEAAANQLPPAD